MLYIGFNVYVVLNEACFLKPMTDHHLHLSETHKLTGVQTVIREKHGGVSILMQNNNPEI